MPMEMDGKPEEELLLRFTQQPKRCPTCGNEISAEGYGMRAKLLCEFCVSRIAVPYPPKRGRPDRSQQGLLITEETKGILIKRDGTVERY